MSLTRREFLKVSGAGLGAAALGNLGIKTTRRTIEELRIKNAKETTTICPYCGVGCGIIVASEDNGKKVINTEGNPDHPINRGNLCSKGSSLIQIGFVDGKPNPRRLTKPLYRGKGASSWKEISWEEAIEKIAKKIKETRDNHFIKTEKALDKDGNPTDKDVTCNRTEAIASLGGAALDNEECYLLVKLLRALGLVYIDNQARI